jgi:hypothetical protein
MDLGITSRQLEPGVISIGLVRNRMVWLIQVAWHPSWHHCVPGDRLSQFVPVLPCLLSFKWERKYCR